MPRPAKPDNIFTSRTRIDCVGCGVIYELLTVMLLIRTREETKTRLRRDMNWA